MAEYKSFHYLMHQVPDAVKPVYVTGPAPLQFHELYTPRGGDDVKQIYKGEKSYWRTRDRIEFCFYESRSWKTMIVSSKNVETQAAYRTIFLNLESLYFELESKARGDREKLTKKKDRKLDEVLLHKSAVDYILARLNIGAEPLPWPKFENGQILPPVISTNDSNESVRVDESDDSLMERMCTFMKLSSDLCDLEIERPKGLPLEAIDPSSIKLEPAKKAPIAASEVTSPVEAESAPLTAEGTPVESNGSSSNTVNSLKAEGASKTARKAKDKDAPVQTGATKVAAPVQASTTSANSKGKPATAAKKSTKESTKS